MKIYLYLESKIFTFSIPKKISGSFSFDENPEEESKLINIEARDNEWILYSTTDSSVIVDGNISNSVNLPNAKMDMNSPFRITCIHENKPKMISQITDILKDANIENLMNKSKKDIAYTIIDLDSEVDVSPIEKINGMIRVSTYKK